MAPNDMAASDAATARHFGAGPINTSSSGRQVNNTISGGSGSAQYNATHQHFHGIQAPDEVQLDEDFRMTLFLTSPEIDRRNLIDVKEGRVSNTCEWIRTTKEYKGFLEGTQRLLWIWGEPGKGKTMLSIFISQDLELEKETRTIYFFCRAEHEQRNTVKDALSSRETLWIHLEELITAVQSERLYCVIDGLDECDESSQQWLARKFISLHSNGDTSGCSVVLLSRYLVELRSLHQVNLDSDYIEQVRSDVKVFVDARTEELFQRISFSGTHRNELRQRLFDGAQGSFLWVGFAMIDLFRQKNENGVMRALGRLPAGLFPLYDRMLRDIEPDSREISLCILRYVALACRPLTLDELAFVASSHSARSGPPITALHIRNLTESCGPLFRIKEGIVTLVHESVRDYTKEAAFLGELGSNTRKAHLQLAWACIDTLTQEIQERPLEAYAAAFWPHHAIEADQLAAELFSHPSCFFAGSSKLRSKWWDSYTRTNRRFQFLMHLGHKKLQGISQISQLQMACFLGIKFWTEDILDNQKPRFHKISLMLRDPVTKRDRDGWTILHWAAFGGQVTIVELLLNRGANPDTRDRHPGRTALHWAAEEGHEATVESLLHHMVNANAEEKLSSYCGTPLHSAAYWGHQTVAKLLLDHGVNVDVRMHDGSTALNRASAAGHTAIVKLLIDHGADVHTEDRYGFTALLRATGKVATVKLLLEHGADANTKDKCNITVLHVAASNKAEDSIKLLLDHGADINAADDNGLNIFYYAFDGYRDVTAHEAIVKLLLEHHADINARNRRGHTTLMEIIARADSKIGSWWHPGRLKTAVRAMVQHGAHFDDDSVEGKRILQLCCEDSEDDY
jgi:ankyrin repeat protein